MGKTERKNLEENLAGLACGEKLAALENESDIIK